MVFELINKLCDAEALAAVDGYIGYSLDMDSATHRFPGATDMYLVITTNVAADYTTGDETYQFQFRTGTGTDGTDINAGARTEFETPAINGDDARVNAAGAEILSAIIPFRITPQRYWQLYYAQVGTTPTITIDAILSIWKPRTEYNIQVVDSNVGLP